MELWIASSNKGKINEFRNLLASIGADVHSITELDFYGAPPETGETFEDNARIKARSLRSIKSNVWVIADDSGLEVEGLNNLPGVHSARYAGEKASDSMNNAKLLKMLKIRSSNRNAQFRCVLVAISPDGNEIVVEASMKGVIATAAQGTGGFGYDPIFIPEGEEKTLADLGPSVKNKISHRAKAIQELKAHLS